MKTKNLKAVVCLTLCLASTGVINVRASDDNVHASDDQNQSVLKQGTETHSPQVNVSSPFDEGTETSLTPGQMSSIRAWANNSKESLDSLLDDVRSLPIRRAKEELISRIKVTVLASAPKSTELLMRYILNRALKVVTTIDQLGDSSRPGVLDQEVRVLKRSVEMALSYYQNDIAYLNGQNTSQVVNLPFAQFGIQYAALLMSVNESLLNASAEYVIAIDALGFLQVDLYKDQNRAAYGVVINKLYQFLQLHPESAPSLACQSVDEMRRIRKVYYESVDELNGITLGQSPQ